MNFKQLKPDFANFRPEKLKTAVGGAIRRPSRTLWIIVLCAIAIVSLVLVIVLRPQPVQPDLPVVAVEPAATEDVNIYGEYVGRIRAQQFVEIRARVEGYLEKMLFAEGT